MAAGDGDVNLGTLGSGSESSSDGSSESPGGAGAAAEGGGWSATALALLTGGGEMMLKVALVGLVALVLLGAYRPWVRWGRRGLGAGAGAGEESPAASLPRMKKRDFSLEQLRQYDGSRNPRILRAVNGKVFDVTKGSKFYGPAGPYGIFAGYSLMIGSVQQCRSLELITSSRSNENTLPQPSWGHQYNSNIANSPESLGKEATVRDY
ncbi:hypothetical protein R6Z07F_001860 [Ovis aries]